MIVKITVKRSIDIISPPRYADDSFTSAFVSTVGIDFKVKTVFRQDKRVKLQIWVSRVRTLTAL